MPGNILIVLGFDANNQTSSQVNHGYEEWPEQVLQSVWQVLI